MSRKRVIRLQQAEGLTARVRKRFKRTTMSDHDQPVAANVLAQDFVADAPNQRWVGDTTEFVIRSSGKLYLAAMLDLYSRFLVGWAVSAINDRHLVMKALLIKTHRMTGSMSRRGNCYDNAVMESWVFYGEARARGALRQLRRRQDGAVRLHRGVLQPAATTLDARPNQSGRV